jgi:hypothetical protein
MLSRATWAFSEDIQSMQTSSRKVFDRFGGRFSQEGPNAQQSDLKAALPLRLSISLSIAIDVPA